MAAIPEKERTTVRAVYDAHTVAHRAEVSRGYLGASVIGRPCARALWFDFRWCGDGPEEVSPNVLRLWQYGHRLEETLAQELRRAGIQVETHDTSGEQFGFTDLGGHFRGHMDGALLGLIEAPKTWHVWECKSHNDKSFRDLLAKGVKASKPEHYAQMQIYMHWSGMSRAYYLAENKNTSELYGERVHYDKEDAEALVAKAEMIIFSDTPPPRISDKPEYYLCKWCRHSDLCHEGGVRNVPSPSCRTCCHATPEREGDARWSCSRHASDIPAEHAREGCGEHVYMPALIGKVTDANADDNWIDVETEHGTLRTGSRKVGVLTSREVYHWRAKAQLLTDPAALKIRESLNAEMVD